MVRDRQRHDRVGRRQHGLPRASTRPRSGRSSTRARARPGRPTRSAGSSGRTRPRTRRCRSRATPPAGSCASTRSSATSTTPATRATTCASRSDTSRPASGPGSSSTTSRCRSRRAAAAPATSSRRSRSTRAATVYAAWIDDNDSNVYYSSSSGPGRDLEHAGAGELLAVGHERVPLGAGRRARARSRSRGTARTLPASPTASRTGPTIRQGATAVKWWGYVGVITERHHRRRDDRRSSASPRSRCTTARSATRGSAARSRRRPARWPTSSASTSTSRGAMRIVYNDTTSQHHGAAPLRGPPGRRQDGPRRQRQRHCVKNPATDATGDAQWPHYSPTGAGANHAAVRLHRPAGRPAERRHAAGADVARDLASLLPPAGKTSSLWLTRFQALSSGDSGEEAYRIFYVGAESTGGLTPAFFAGSTTCTDTTPAELQGRELPGAAADRGPRLREHARRGRAALRRSGVRSTGALLYNVTALSGGRNAADDLYADVDATHSFDYVLGSNAAARAAEVKLRRGTGCAGPRLVQVGFRLAASHLREPAREHGFLRALRSWLRIAGATRA